MHTNHRQNSLSSGLMFESHSSFQFWSEECRFVFPDVSTNFEKTFGPLPRLTSREFFGPQRKVPITPFVCRCQRAYFIALPFRITFKYGHCFSRILMKCSADGEYRSWRSVLEDLVPFSGWTVLGFLAKESIKVQRYASQFFNIAHRRDGSFVGCPFSSRFLVRHVTFAFMQERTLVAATAAFFGFVLDTMCRVPIVT